MTCTKAQILALLLNIKRDLDDCETTKCMRSIINHYITLIEEKTIEEIKNELLM